MNNIYNESTNELPCKDNWDLSKNSSECNGEQIKPFIPVHSINWRWW